MKKFRKPWKLRPAVRFLRKPAKKTEPLPVSKEAAIAYNGLALKTLSDRVRTGSGNCLISPYSLLAALQLAEAGAAGETEKELQALLGKKPETRAALRAAIRRLGSDGGALKCANAAYVSDSIAGAVKKPYLERLAQEYGAALLKPQGEQPDDVINAWVRQQTDGVIPKLVNSPEEVGDVCLLNAGSFQSEWKEAYERCDIDFDDFHPSADPKETFDCTMLSSTESRYLASRDFVGFLRPYKDSDYSFLALLPRKELYEPRKILKLLDGKKLTELIAGAKNEDVDVTIPEFTFDDSAELSGTLRSLGVKSLFDEKSANLARMTDREQTHVDQILQKTHISVDRAGTWTYVATGECEILGLMDFFQGTQPVNLDRPFLFGILHEPTGLPVFLGCVTRPTETVCDF